MSELLPCPFCGDVPGLPSGDGTQYEIECTGCGQAMASVQICDLMTLEERESDNFTSYRYAEEFVERAKNAAVTNWNHRAQPAPGAEVVDDTQRLNWLEQAANEPGGLLLHDGTVTPPRLGLGLRPGSVRRSLREAIDTAIAAHSAGNAQTGEGESK